MQVDIKQETLQYRIARVIAKIQDLEEILSAIVAETRSFLGTDRVKIYKFHLDGSGQVIAESVDDSRLPSLLGLNFPADDIPPQARELFIKSQVCSIVNVENQEIGHSSLFDPENKEFWAETIRYRPVDPCHVEYLTAMGVTSSIVVPIMDGNDFWGLLVSHHATARSVSESEVEVLQMVVANLSVAIARDLVVVQLREKETREVIIKKISTLLEEDVINNYYQALTEVVVAFGGSGGRLCKITGTMEFSDASIKSFADCLAAGDERVRVYAYGQQPIIPNQAKYKLMEQYHVWQEHYKSGEYDIWAIADVYKVPELRTLQVAFRPTKIRSMLMIPLHKNQKLLGYLSIFSDELETVTHWAGEFDPDERQLYPRQSFQVWQESKTAQPRLWKVEEIELAKYLGQKFALAIYGNQVYQLEQINPDLSARFQTERLKLEQKHQQQALLEVVAKIRNSLDLETIFQTTTKEVCQLTSSDRVSVYRFDADWGGEFVGDFEATSPEWSNLPKFGVGTIWNDTYLQQTQGGRYRENETFAVDNIYQMGFADCHIHILEQFQIKAFVITPIFVQQKLWGLLAAYQHSQPRRWDVSDIQFLTQTAAQLGVAIQQAELLAQTRQQTVELQKERLQQQLLFDVVTKIRESLDLDTIFQATTKGACELLQAERVSVYHFNSDWGGRFVGGFEAVSSEWSNLSKLGVGTVWDDTYLQQTQGGRYRNNETFVVDDIYQMGFAECHVDILEQYQIKAFAIAPIFVQQKLWGLLAAYQHSQPRHWHVSDIKFLIQTAAQLGVALQQAELLAKTRQQAINLQKALDDLSISEEQKQFLFRIVHKMRQSLEIVT
ncbi:multi-sensor signal transduction histidine kinase [Calothrix sp. NIES-4071]|nr:multi-sensor signal transduction histidine kinase [Calothrix sp. NIES-4071]BAZ54835.1 multi-sensor signal transduction histidine kinase [Calothrix sp. NIES-4105]